VHKEPFILSGEYRKTEILTLPKPCIYYDVLSLGGGGLRKFEILRLEVGICPGERRDLREMANEAESRLKKQ
jgi:hypothetical protein